MRKRTTVRRLCLYALFSAVLCVISPIAIPIGAIPISFSACAVLLCSIVLGGRAPIPVAVYLAAGALGIPVFAGGMAGFGVLLGPTGGFLWSYLPMSALTGTLYSALNRRCKAAGKRFAWTVVIGICGMLICYLFGVVQYMLVANASVFSAISVCVLPFLFFDLCKLVMIALLGRRLTSLPAIREMMTDRS